MEKQKIIRYNISIKTEDNSAGGFLMESTKKEPIKEAIEAMIEQLLEKGITHLQDKSLDNLDYDSLRLLLTIEQMKEEKED